MQSTATSYQQKFYNEVVKLVSEPTYQAAWRAAAVPLWLPRPLFSRLLATGHEQSDGLLTQLDRFSFVKQLRSRRTAGSYRQTEPIYAIDADARLAILRTWIDQGARGFLEAHQVALDYWLEHKDRNTFTRHRNEIYHKSFTDTRAAIVDLIRYFRRYEAARTFAAIERLLDTVSEAQQLLLLLDQKNPPSDNTPPSSPVAPTPSDVGKLLTYLRIRLAQLRERWDDARAAGLAELRSDNELRSDLFPFVARTNAVQLLHEAAHDVSKASFADAIRECELALRRLRQESESDFIRDIIDAEETDTYLIMGDAYASFANDLRGPRALWYPEPSAWQGIRTIATFLFSLPTTIYFILKIGVHRWDYAMSPVLYRLDWMVAKLYIEAIDYYERAKESMPSDHESTGHVTVDEKLAAVYLALGNATLAKNTLIRLEERLDPSLSVYRKAVLNALLAETEIRLGQPKAAIELSSSAIPVLEDYGDIDRAIAAHEALAEAYFAADRREDATHEFLAAIKAHQDQSPPNTGSATSAAERLNQLLAPAPLPEAVEAEIAERLPVRRYSLVYRHPFSKAYKLLLFALMSVLLFILPVRLIQVNQTYELEPPQELRFDANIAVRGGLLGDAEIEGGVLPDQVRNVDYVPKVDEAWIWAGIVAILLLIVGAILVGEAIIAFTSLEEIERRVQRAQVEFDGQEIRVGASGRQVTTLVSEIRRLLSANTRLISTPLPAFSSFTIVAEEGHTVIDGNTAWYNSLCHRIRRMTPSARQHSADYCVMRSVVFGVLVSSSILFLMLALAIRAEAPLLNQSLVGPYRATDLVPFLILGVLIAPLFWFVGRPLYIAHYRTPQSRWPLAVFVIGLALLIFEGASGFRSLISSINLYSPLLIVLLLGLPLLFWWSALNQTGQRVYPAPLRFMAIGFAFMVLVAMSGVVWQEVSSYHAFVKGVNWHHAVVDNEGNPEVSFAISQAYASYRAAMRRSEVPAFGMLTSRAVGSRPGSDPSCIAEGRQVGGMARSNLNALATRLSLELRSPIELTHAIECDPRNAELYYWRGLIHYTSQRYDAAINDLQSYFSHSSQADLQTVYAYNAHLLLGWSYYHRKQPQDALRQFGLAASIVPASTQAEFGYGATLYDSGYYAWASEAVSKTLALPGAAEDPRIHKLEGLVNWRLGSPGSENRCAAYEKSLEAFANAIRWHPPTYDNVDPELATYHRLEGIILWLIDDIDCRWSSDVHATLSARRTVLQSAADSFGRAAELDPAKADYWQMRGRLSTTRWVFSGEQNSRRQTDPDEWLRPILQDMERALALEPHDDIENGRDYRPNRWITAVVAPTINNDIDYALCTGNIERAEKLYALALEARDLLEDPESFPSPPEWWLTASSVLPWQLPPIGVRQALPPIAFLCGEVGLTNIVLLNPSTMDFEVAVNAPCELSNIAWTPDGQALLYQNGCRITRAQRAYETAFDLWIIDVGDRESHAIRPTTTHHMLEGEFSPDGRKLAFRRDPYPSDVVADGELWVADASGANGRFLGIYGRSPTWSPDGNYIAYMSNDRGNELWNIYIYDIAADNSWQFTDGCQENGCRFPDWSPDGKQIIYGEGGSRTMYVSSFPAGESEILLTDGACPSWATKDLIVFNSSRGVEVAKIDGEESERWLLAPGGFCAAASPIVAELAQSDN